MAIKELVVVEFTSAADDKQLEIGDKYSYFQDPKTKKYYRPIEGFCVKGKDLSDRFIEVPAE